MTLNCDQIVIEALRDARADRLMRELRRDYPQFVRYCEHVRHMLEILSPKSQELYEPKCWTCQIEERNRGKEHE